MTWDKSGNSCTDEELRELLKQGGAIDLSYAKLVGVNLKKADLQGADLQGADLQGADLRMANLEEADLGMVNLEGANLEGANLKMANLEMANLEGAILQGANLEGADLGMANLKGTDIKKHQLESAINWQNTIGIPPEFISNSQLIELQEKQKQIKQLEYKLHKAKQEPENNQIQELESKITQFKQGLTLGKNIENAQNTLEKSLKSADDRIQEYNKNVKIIGRIALELMGLKLLVIVLFWYHYEKFIPLFEILNAWALTLFSFPMLIILTIAITLFRHQKKLLDEVRHYSSEKRQIELYSGLLKASQYVAESFNDPQKSAEYVKETFDKIRDRILSEQPHANTAGSAVEQEEYSSSLEPLIKVISDMIAKSEVKK